MKLGWFRRGPPPPSATRWVVLDVESTGLDPTSDRLLAIAAIAVRPQAGGIAVDLADSFDAVLRHEAPKDRPADKANILVHGIGVGAMRAGHEPAAVLRHFRQWAADAPRLGFHVGFDRIMLERAEAEHLGRSESAAWLDIEPLAASSYPDVKAHALDEWLAHFAIPCLQRHQAIADVLATAELLQHLWPRLRREGGGRYDSLARLAAARRWVTR